MTEPPEAPGPPVGAPRAAASPEAPGAPERIEELLLGGPCRYTRREAAAAADMPLDEAAALWHALGFAHAGDDEVMFTEGDVAALRIVRTLIDYEVIDRSAETSVTRMVGQTMSRLAEWQARVLAGLIRDRPEALPGGDVARFVGEVVPLLEQVQAFAWRRHLAAYARRVLGSADGTATHTAVVGFLDMTGYTDLTRRLSQEQLAVLLERFEAAASGVVADNRGRIVKTLGDEVLFVADHPGDGARIALQLVEYAAADAELPDLCGGLAAGEVLWRYGDVAGEVANIASRLTGLARPGTVLVDRALAAELADQPEFDVVRLRHVAVRGYRHLEPWALRRGRVGQSPA
jgi:adenylate cyclase